jgi:hypothetical protein
VFEACDVHLRLGQGVKWDLEGQEPSAYWKSVSSLPPVQDCLKLTFLSPSRCRGNLEGLVSIMPEQWKQRYKDWRHLPDTALECIAIGNCSC